MQKRQRQDKLLSIIGSTQITSQGDLALHLRREGYKVTQASISRDLDELGIIKIGGYYSLPEREINADFGAIRLDTAGDNLIVARCASGLASAITVRIDAARLPEIVGTVAGDDTIIIAVKDRGFQETALSKIAKMFA